MSWKENLLRKNTFHHQRFVTSLMTSKSIKKNGKLVSDTSIREDIAKRIILAEKEQIRYTLIFDYDLEYGQPSIITLIDRDALIAAYIADGKHEDIDTIKDMCQYLIDEPYKVCRGIESVGADIFDDSRRFKDPTEYDRKAKEETIWDE